MFQGIVKWSNSGLGYGAIEPKTPVNGRTDLHFCLCTVVGAAGPLDSIPPGESVEFEISSDGEILSVRRSKMHNAT